MKIGRLTVSDQASAGIRERTLIVNLPGTPSAVAECLTILADAIREGVGHLRGTAPR